MGSTLNVEELTLAAMEKLDIFSYGTEIQEVTHEYRYSMSFSCCTCETLFTAVKSVLYTTIYHNLI